MGGTGERIDRLKILDKTALDLFSPEDLVKVGDQLSKNRLVPAKFENSSFSPRPVLRRSSVPRLCDREEGDPTWRPRRSAGSTNPSRLQNLRSSNFARADSAEFSPRSGFSSNVCEALRDQGLVIEIDPTSQERAEEQASRNSSVDKRKKLDHDFDKLLSAGSNVEGGSQTDRITSQA